MEWLIVFTALLGASIWVGGFVTLVVVQRAAQMTLGDGDRVEFFRSLGRSFGIVSGIALLLATVSGGLLLRGREWDGLALAAVLLLVALVLAVAVGVVQARAMTRLRQNSIEHPSDGELERRIRVGALRARQLRTGIGALSIVLLAVVAALAV